MESISTSNFAASQKCQCVASTHTTRTLLCCMYGLLNGFFGETESSRDDCYPPISSQHGHCYFQKSFPLVSFCHKVTLTTKHAGAGGWCREQLPEAPTLRCSCGHSIPWLPCSSAGHNPAKQSCSGQGMVFPVEGRCHLDPSLAEGKPFQAQWLEGQMLLYQKIRSETKQHASTLNAQ